VLPKKWAELRRGRITSNPRRRKKVKNRLSQSTKFQCWGWARGTGKIFPRKGKKKREGGQRVSRGKTGRGFERNGRQGGLSSLGTRSNPLQ